MNHKSRDWVLTYHRWPRGSFTVPERLLGLLVVDWGVSLGPAPAAGALAGAEAAAAAEPRGPLLVWDLGAVAKPATAASTPRALQAPFCEGPDDWAMQCATVAENGVLGTGACAQAHGA